MLTIACESWNNGGSAASRYDIGLYRFATMDGPRLCHVLVCLGGQGRTVCFEVLVNMCT